MKYDKSDWIGEGFLVYIGIYTLSSLLTDSAEIIKKNVMRVRDEILTALSEGRIAFYDIIPDRYEKTNIINNDVRDIYRRSAMGKMFEREEARKVMNTDITELFSGGSKIYTLEHPLRAAFIYDKDIERSRWINSHEAGRLYLSSMMDNVSVRSYMKSKEQTVTEVINKAVSEGCELIFTVRQSMIEQTLQAALEHPKEKFFNCSVGQTYSSVGCYQGKLYEATFLIGILAADMVLREGGKHEVGYFLCQKKHLNNRAQRICGGSISYRPRMPHHSGIPQGDRYHSKIQRPGDRSLCRYGICFHRHRQARRSFPHRRSPRISRHSLLQLGQILCKPCSVHHYGHL